MARIRSIKPEFFTSPDVAAMTMFERVTFIGLWTHADDEGRCLADARLICAALFPLDDDIGPLEVQSAIDTFHRRDQVVLYESSGNSPESSGDRRYLAVAHWNHQKISHPTASKLPGPNDDGSHLLKPLSGNTPEPSGSPLEPSGSPPESFRSDQGSGIRDQGSGISMGAAEISLGAAVETYRGGATRQEDLWTALEHELGPARTTTEKNLRGKTVNELKQLQTTPFDIHARCSEYRRRWPDASLTDSALLKHWSALAEAQIITGQMNNGTAALLKVVNESNRRGAS